MSSYAVARLDLHASVLSTCKIDANVAAGCMGRVVDFCAAGDKSEDAGLTEYELPYGMTPDEALQDFFSIILNNSRFLYVLTHAMENSRN